MRCMLILLCLIFSLPAYSADNLPNEQPEPIQEQTIVENIEKAENGETAVKSEKTSSPKDQSLEDFLKQQEELWLKEKGKTKVADNSAVNTVLPPPSVLSESVSEEIKTPTEMADLAPKVASPAPARKTAVKKSPEKILVKEVLKEDTSSPAVTEEALQEEASADKKDTGYKENWPAFFRGVAFALLLAGAVWLLSKYQ